MIRMEIETKICECGNEYQELEWDPHYDRYGLMGSGYAIYFRCKECRKKSDKK